MEEWLSYLSTGFKAIENGTGDVPSALTEMAGMTGHVFDAANSGFPIIIEFWRQAITEPAIWQQAVRPYTNYLVFFEEMIKKGIAEGSLDPSLNTEIAAQLLMALAMGFLLQASFDPKGASWTEATISGMQIIIKGLRR